MSKIQRWFLLCFILNSVFLDKARCDNTVHCPEVGKIDCAHGYKPEGNETVCCSDLQVYPNFCFFAQEKCRNPSLTVLYLGDCLQTTAVPASDFPITPDSSVTSKPHTSNPSNIVSSVFCANKEQIECNNDLDPVCGTDNTFYQNNCEFVKAICDNHDLGFQDLSACKANRRVRRRPEYV
ncbi:negative regulation of serine-type peptidase [Mactra antiquata]